MPYKDQEKQRDFQRKHYLKNKALFTSRSQHRRYERRKWFNEVMSKMKCNICGENERCCLDFHHIDPKQKDFAVSRLLSDLRSKERILKEIEKCVVLCANCHRKVHSGVLVIGV